MRFAAGLAVLVSLAVSAAALEEGLPSKTAVYIAAARAVGSKNPDRARRNPDYLAIKFLGPQERAILPDYPMQGLDLPFAAAVQKMGNASNVREQTRRTRWFDTAMLDALRGGAAQVVILGAGFDSRGYRFARELRGRVLFEVDSAPTQEYKKRRVREIVGRLPSNVRFVPMDFTRDNLLDQLAGAGYSPAKRTFFLWEGVSMYLPEPAVQQTLHFVRDHAAAGSSIAFNYALSTNPWLNNPNTTWAKWGEPWVFGFPGGGAAGYVRHEGLGIAFDELTGPYEGQCIAVAEL